MTGQRGAERPAAADPGKGGVASASAGAGSARRPRLILLLPLAIFLGLAGLFLAQLLSGRDIAEVPSALIGQPFMKVQNEYTRKYEGTGLGLSLVKGLVALHGGTFVIESRQGQGTVITVRVPADGSGIAGDDEQQMAPSSTVDFPPRLAAAMETVYQPSHDGKDTQDERARQKTA